MVNFKILDMTHIFRSGLIALILLTLPIVLFASEYSIPRIDMEVSITEDGLVRITERRTYVFDGDFTWADYQLPKNGFTQIQSISVSENGNEYINQNTEEDGTFSVSESDDAYIIKWYYSASDTSRTFTVSYILEGAVAVGPEWTEFFWNYLSSSRQKSTEEFDLSFRLPADVSQDSLYTFTRRKADDFEFEPQQDGYNASGRSISRRQSARIRTLFPTAVFDLINVSITHPDLQLSGVLQDEQIYRQNLEEQAERDAYYAALTPAATIILALISLLVFIWVYRTYGKRHSTSSLSSRETLVIPGQQPPALIGKLMMAKQTSSNHLVATLFELARRGWFTITEETTEKDGWFSSDKATFRVSMPDQKPDDTLLEHEQMITDFAKQRIAGGDDTIEELFKGTDSVVSKWYSKWKKQVKQQFDEKNWVDQKSYKGVYINMFPQVILLALAIALLIVGSPIALIAVILITFLLIGSLFIIRRTPEGEEVHSRWKSYMEGLKNADKRTIRMEHLDRHFIYAVALHLRKNQIETLLYTTNQSAQSVIPWIILTQGSASSAASVASSISTLAATGSTSFSGATAGGTGASVGAAGGGASGGAG